MTDQRSDQPEAFYNRIRAQTRPGSKPGFGGAIAVVAFIVAAALIVLALAQTRFDLQQQILVGIFVVAAVNLVLAVTWTAARPRAGK